MAKTGLRLSRVSVACTAASGRPLPDHHDGTICDRLQPDLVLVPHSLRKVAVVEVSRPMDRSSEQLTAAAVQHTREDVHLCTTHGGAAGLSRRRVTSGDLPWVIGVRGFLDSESIRCCLEFLELPLQSWWQIIKDTAKESVTAFYSLHHVRCTAFNSSPKSSGCEPHEPMREHRTPVAAPLTLMTRGDLATENGGDDRSATSM
jgi:hypothetical protein